MQQVSVDEAITKFEYLIQAALNGEEIVVTKDGEPVVKFVAVAHKHQPQFGSAGNLNISLADDFDAPLPEFADYTP